MCECVLGGQGWDRGEVGGGVLYAGNTRNGVIDPETVSYHNSSWIGLCMFI